MTATSFYNMIAKSFLLSSLLFYQASSSNIFDESSSNDIGNHLESNGIIPSYAYAGKWKVVEAYLDDEEVGIPSDDDVYLTFKKGISEDGNATSYLLGVKAFNSFGSDVTILERDEDDGFDNIEVGVVMGTLAFPPEDYLEIENFISAELSEMNKMMVGSYDDDEDDHELVMKSDNAVLICRWVPYEGTWKLTKAYDYKGHIGFKVAFPESADITLVFTEIHDSPYNYTLQANVYNTHGTEVDIVGSNSKGFDLITLGPVASTRMMPPDDMKDIDDFFVTSMSSFKKMKYYVSDDGDKWELMMKGESGNIYCERVE